MDSKVVSCDEAVLLLRDGDTLCNSGFVGNGTPDELLAGLERRFLATGEPRDLTLLFAAGQGDGKERGLSPTTRLSSVIANSVERMSMA